MMPRPGKAAGRSIVLLATGIAALATAGNSPMVREPTRIPAEPLGLALRNLASERGLQVVYDSGKVDRETTRGASGNLTADEALTQLLRGTGFTYRKMSDSGIAIEPLARRDGRAAPHPRLVAPPPAGAGPSTGSSSETAPPPLGQVTIETSEERQTMRRKVDHFVAAAIVQPSSDALYRWNVPICPLVAGLPKAFGELILERISQAAAEAHAPLAGRECHGDLYVVAHDEVGQLLRKWWQEDRQLYNLAHVGIEPAERFNDSRRPIRAWYNTRWESPGGAGCIPAESAAILGAGLSGSFDAQTCTDGIDTHLTYASTGSNIFSAIVVIDMSRMRGMTLQQLADYIALIGLANVRLDSGPSPVPSILELFGTGPAPQGLTRWDRALLYSLYHTSPSDKLQVSEIESAMVRRIAP